MAVVITGSTITAPDGAIDAADLTGTLPALDGSAITDLNAAELTGTLPAIDGSALTGVGGITGEITLVADSTSSYTFTEEGLYIFKSRGQYTVTANMRLTGEHSGFKFSGREDYSGMIYDRTETAYYSSYQYNHGMWQFYMHANGTLQDWSTSNSSGSASSNGWQIWRVN